MPFETNRTWRKRRTKLVKDNPAAAARITTEHLARASVQDKRGYSKKRHKSECKLTREAKPAAQEEPSCESRRVCDVDA